MLLSIDTCGFHGTVALARLSGDDLEILDQTELPGKTYSARLVPAIRDRLAAHNTVPADLAAIVVTSGPGSFTGIRIGLSTAKGLAEVHRTPILAVSRLAVLAHVAQTRAAALDASRGEFYFGDFGSRSTEALLSGGRLQEESVLLGESLAACEPSILALAPRARLVAPPTAADALRFALPRLRARNFDSPIALDGHYLRRSDAEIFSRPHPVIRPMEAADLDAVAAIAAACPEAPRWTPSDYAAFLAPASASGPLRTAFVAAVGAEVFGFAAASLLLDGEENRCELESMAVRVDARRQGTGTALLHAVQDWAAAQGARTLALEVRAANSPAIRLYQRFGLCPQGRRPRYYTDPEEDAVLLAAPVTSDSVPAPISTAKPVEGGPPRC